MRRFPKDIRTRADKLRDLANNSGAFKGERDNALRELHRMGELSADIKDLFDIEIDNDFEVELAKEKERQRVEAERQRKALEEALAAERLAFEKAERLAREERYREQERRRAEARAAKEWAEHEAKKKVEAERAKKKQAENEVAMQVLRERMAVQGKAEEEESRRRAEEEAKRRVSTKQSSAATRDERLAAVERSPFRVRGGGLPMDPCPVCHVDSALAVEGALSDDPAKLKYRCDYCDQGFDVIKVFGDILMYSRRNDKVRGVSRYQG